MDKTEIVITAVDNASFALGKVGGSLGALVNPAHAVNTALGSFAGGAAIAAFGAIAKQAIDAADGLNDLSQKTGIAIKDLAAYKLAADQSGSSLEGVAKGMKTLSSNLTENGAAFAKIGIDTKDANVAMRQLADIFKDMPDGVEKSALATKLFGKAGQELIPLLNQGSEGLDRSAKGSEAYGKAMAELAPGADKFNDNLAQISLISKEVGASFANILIPSLNSATESFIAAQKAGTGFFRAFAEAALGAAGGQSAEERIRGLTKELKAAQEVLAVPDQSTATIELYTQRVDELTKKLKVLQQLNPEVKISGNQGQIREIENQIARKAAGIAPGIMDLLKTDSKPAKSAGPDIFKQLTEQAAQYARQLDATAEKGAKLTRAEEMMLVAKEKLTPKQYEQLKVTLDHAAGMEKSARASEKARKQEEDWVKVAEKAKEVVADHVRSLEDKARAAEFELETYGKTKTEIESLIIARLEEQHAMVEGFDSQEELAANLEKEIAARKRLRDAMAGNELLEANAAAAKKSEEEWQRAWEQIGDSLTDEIMRGGKSAGELLKDYFRTLVLKPVIQGGVQSLMGAAGLGNLGGNFGGNGLGGALMSAGSSLSGVSGLAGLAGGLGAFGGGFTAGSLGGFTAASAIGGTVGTVGGASAGTAFGAYAGAALPYLAAGLAIASALSSPGGGPKSFASGGDLTADFTNTRSGEIDALAASIKQSYADVIRGFGGTPGSISAAFIGESDPQGTASDFTRFRVRVGDQERFDMDEFGRGEWQKNAAGVAAKAILAALEATNINTLVDQYLDAFNIADMGGTQASQILETVRALSIVTGDLPDMMEDARRAGLSAYGVWQESEEGLRDLAAASDGSLGSLQQLGTAMQARYATELQLVQQIQTAMGSTAALFGDSIRSVQLSVLDDQGKYDFFDREAARLRDTLATLTDPELITQYAQRLNTSIMSGYGVLDADQQRASADSFITLLEQGEQLAQERYEASQQSIVDNQRALNTEIVTLIDAAMGRAATAIAAAGSIPQRVDVGVNVRVDGPAQVETVAIGTGG
jgi:hypothetical protein